MIKYLVAALCLLVPMTALGQGSSQKGANLPHFAIADLPTTCTADRDVVVVTDAATAGSCTSDGGTAASLCVCNSTGTGFEATSGTGTSGTLPVTDDVSMAEGDVDDTKEVRFEVDGLTTGTTRVLTVPDEDIDLHGSKQDQIERFRTYSPLDYGAVCNFKSGDTTATLNDDGPGINAAIQAAVPNGQQSVAAGRVFIPGHCYTEEQISWASGVQIEGVSRKGAGIWCAQGLNDDCVKAEGSTHSSTVMRKMQIGRAAPCVQSGLMGGPSEFSATCTRQTTTDTKGSGIHYVVQTADGKNIEETWLSGHPEFGIWVDQGTDGFWADDIGLFNNGHWAGETEQGTVSGTDTTLTDSGVAWDADEWNGYFVTIVESGETRARLITDTTTDTITFASLSATDAFSITGSSTYTVDRGGGIIIEASTAIGEPSGITDVVGCHINNVVADTNAPATLIHFGGQTENGSSCTFSNIDVEGTATAYCGVLLTNSTESIKVDGINMRGAGSLAAICMDGNSIPRNVMYDNITIKESQTSYYVDMSTLDRADMRLQLGRHRSGHWMFSGNNGALFTGPKWQGALTEPPYACVQEFNGHYYYDTEDGPCFCDGDANGSGATPVWCTFAGGQGCASTTCDNP